MVANELSDVSAAQELDILQARRDESGTPGILWITYIEEVLAQLLERKGVRVMLGGQALEVDEACSADGALPLFIAHAAETLKKIPDSKNVGGWLNHLLIVPDDDALTGYAVQALDTDAVTPVGPVLLLLSDTVHYALTQSAEGTLELDALTKPAPTNWAAQESSRETHMVEDIFS